MASQINKLFFIFPIFLFTFFIGCANSLATSEDPFIRVAVGKDLDFAVVAVEGYYEIIDRKDGLILLKDRVLQKSKVVAQNGGIYIGEDFYPSRHLRLTPHKDVLIQLGQEYRRYRGFTDIIALENDKIMLVNVLPLERYIRGVLYHEITHRWPMEAMKAQAVAVRTYALYQMDKNRDNFFDVTSDIYSQVYGGRSAERFRSNLAVKYTRGKVMTYLGKVLPAYFHSNCGGHTENVSELWNQNLAPLRGVKCPYCKNAPGYHWKKNFQLSEIQKKLNQHGYKLGLIKEITVLERDPSGRIRTLKITTRDGKTSQITGKKFREIIGPNAVKSNKYEIHMQGYYMDLIGKGWGHGVGMCQWGAYNMAKQRHSYDEILKFYYPGIKIQKIENLGSL